jgi:hypothetical protein
MSHRDFTPSPSAFSASVLRDSASFWRRGWTVSFLGPTSFVPHPSEATASDRPQTPRTRRVFMMRIMVAAIQEADQQDDAGCCI